MLSNAWIYLLHKRFCLFFPLFMLLAFVACSPVTTIKHKDITQYTPKYDSFAEMIASPYKEELSKQKDGALIIQDGGNALMYRLAFIQMAQTSIDIQTYIYKDELTPTLIANELYEAANRGVKVRILIDANGVPSNLDFLLPLEAHKNIEIRIFHPYFARVGILHLFEALFSFTRMNKRMHNKLFIFDESALIVGGRNIADSYFDNATINFVDMDLLLIGNLAKDARMNFEEFWNYKRSIPLKLFFTKKALQEQIQNNTFYKQLEFYKGKYNIQQAQWQEYLESIESFKRRYGNKELRMLWGHGVFLADLPQKVDKEVSSETTPILEALYYNFNQARDSIFLTSSYLIPDSGTMDIWRDFIEKKGLKIKVLTNSLAATDVKIVYSHWQNYRDQLVLMGVDVYEHKNFLESEDTPNFMTDEFDEVLQKEKVKKIDLSDNTPHKYKLNSRKNKKFYRLLGDNVSLHSKYMVIDESSVGVGSFNLDYRSIMLNTESIVFFKSHELAKELKDIMQKQMQESYQVVCNQVNKKCHWKTNKDGESQIFWDSPDSTLWQRIFQSIGSIMPEKLL